MNLQSKIAKRLTCGIALPRFTFNNPELPNVRVQRAINLSVLGYQKHGALQSWIRGLPVIRGLVVELKK
jgi:hypothetical protein